MDNTEQFVFAACAWCVLGAFCMMAPNTKDTDIYLDENDLWFYPVFAPIIAVMLISCYYVDLEKFVKRIHLHDE